MDIIQYGLAFRFACASLLMLFGAYAILKGITTITAQDYQQSLRKLSVQSAQIGQKALGDVAIAPMLEAAAQLITAVNQLVRTAVGVGAFLSMGGVLLMLVGYALLPH